LSDRHFVIYYPQEVEWILNGCRSEIEIGEVEIELAPSKKNPVAKKLFAESSKLDPLHEEFSDMDSEVEEEQEEVRRKVRLARKEPVTIAYGYSLVCDNLNKNFVPHDSYSGAVMKKLDCVSVEAIFNRVGQNVDDFRETKRIERAINVPMENFMISQDDVDIIKDEQLVMIVRMLCLNMPLFQCLRKEINRHIEHEYSEESKQRSTTVSLGIINENENQTAGMVAILQELKKYAAKRAEGKFNMVLFGDGLTAHRVDAAERLRAAAKFPEEYLVEFVPSVGAWHKRVIIVDLDMKYLYKSTEYCSSPGSLPYLRNRFGHRKVTENTKHCFNATSRFFRFATTSYVIAYACQLLKLNSVTDTPSGIKTDKDSLRVVLYDVASQIRDNCLQNFQRPFLQDKYCFCQRGYHDEGVEDYRWIACENINCQNHLWYHLECLEEKGVKVNPTFCSQEEEFVNEVSYEDQDDSNFIARGEEEVEFFFETGKNSKEKKFFCSSECKKALEDKKFIYSKTLIFAGLMQEVTRDAIRENDGKRLLAHLKFEYFRFFYRRHPIYRQIMTRVLASIGGYDPPNVGFDIMHNSTVNICGGKGKNIESDLYNEFCNKILKQYLNSLYGQATDGAVQRKARAIGILKEVSEEITKSLNDEDDFMRSGKDQEKWKNDIEKCVEIILDNKLLEYCCKRHHSGFEKFNSDFLCLQNIEDFKQSVKKICKKLDFQRDCLDLN